LTAKKEKTRLSEPFFVNRGDGIAYTLAHKDERRKLTLGKADGVLLVNTWLWHSWPGCSAENACHHRVEKTARGSEQCLGRHGRRRSGYHRRASGANAVAAVRGWRYRPVRLYRQNREEGVKESEREGNDDRRHNMWRQHQYH